MRFIWKSVATNQTLWFWADFWVCLCGVFAIPLPCLQLQGSQRRAVFRLRVQEWAAPCRALAPLSALCNSKCLWQVVCWALPACIWHSRAHLLADYPLCLDVKRGYFQPGFGAVLGRVMLGGICYNRSETSWEVHPNKKGKMSTANSDSSVLLVIPERVYCAFKITLKQLTSSVMEHHYIFFKFLAKKQPLRACRTIMSWGTVF